MKKRFIDEVMTGISEDGDAWFPVKEICRNHDISDADFYISQKKVGSMESHEARRLKHLEEEIAKLKRRLVGIMLDKVAMKVASNRSCRS